MSEQENKHYENDILKPLAQRSISFFSDDLGIGVESSDFEILNPKSVEMKKNTAMIGTGGSVQVLITMGYDDMLLNKMLEVFMEGEEVDADEIEEIRESVSCEVINIVVGNALVNPVDETTLSITPPLLINEAKSLSKHRSSEIAVTTITTEFGDMILTVIGPKKLFTKELKFKEI